MSYRLYWRRNDGVNGHVWLSTGDLDALTTEMRLQGMPWPGDRLPDPGAEAVVEADEVESVIAAGREAPVTHHPQYRAPSGDRAGIGPIRSRGEASARPYHRRASGWK